MSYWTKPTPDLIRKTIARLAAAEHVSYFFRRLNNPLWVEPLEEGGLFSNPPEATVSGGVERFVPWPQSEYLLRMAPLAPQAVARVIRSVKTNNPLVQRDLVRAAALLPATEAASLVPVVRKWLSGPRVLWIADDVAALVRHLAAEQQVESAFQLSAELLALSRAPQREAGTRQRPVAVGRLEAWGYGRAIDQIVPSLTQADPLRTVDLLLNKYRDLSRIEHRLKDDGSRIWLPDLREDDRNPDLKAVLATRTLKACEDVARRGHGLLEAVVTALEEPDIELLNRIAAQLITDHQSIRLAAPRLLTPDFWHKPGIDRERAAMAATLLDRFDSGDRDRVISIVSSEPDRASFDLRFQLSEGRPAVEADFQSYRRRRLWRALAPIEKHLQGGSRVLYLDLVREFGEPPQERAEKAVWVGPTSPLSDTEIKALDPEKLLEYLRSWRPSPGFATASPEGLGRLIASAVAEAPTKYARVADDWKVGIHPTYLRHFFFGLESAIPKKTLDDWEPIVSLMEHVVAQPRDDARPEMENADPFDLDQDWRNARHEIARFLDEAISSKAPPSEFKRRVWGILRVLLSDPDPTEAEDDERPGMEPYALAINSVRGEALHAVIQLGLWVSKEPRDQRPSEDQSLIRDEIATWLNSLLDRSIEPTSAVRSVFGRFFPWLRLIDRGWALRARELIFSQDAQGSAAWNAYLHYCPVFDETFPELRLEYSRAIALLGSEKPAEGLSRDLDRMLTEHIAVASARGLTNWNDRGSVIADFFGRAPAALRGEFMSFLGRWMESWKDKPDGGLVARLQRLWEWRAESARTLPPSEQLIELQEFGWWFGVEFLPADWRVRNLVIVVGITGGRLPNHAEIVETLAKLSGEYPLEVVTILHAILGTAESLYISQSLVSIGAILTAALANGPDASRIAIAINDRLMLVGIHSYRGLFREAT